jgi:hypothetical protein
VTGAAPLEPTTDGRFRADDGITGTSAAGSAGIDRANPGMRHTRRR